MPKYSKKAKDKVKKVMEEYKEGSLKSGKSNKKVKSRKQAIAIGLSEARKAGAKVPPAKNNLKQRVIIMKKLLILLVLISLFQSQINAMCSREGEACYVGKKQGTCHIQCSYGQSFVNCNGGVCKVS